MHHKFSRKSTPNKIWNQEVPIIVKGREVDVYIQEAIGEPHLYNELTHLLDHAFEGSIIRLHLNTPGGIIDSAMKVHHSIKNSKATVVAVLTGSVASAGTVLTMACDRIEVAPFTQFMIHNYSGGTGGKGHEIKAYVEFSNRELNTAFKEIYKGFVTDEEIGDIIDGRDLWLNTSEVLERWNSKNVPVA